MSPEELENGTWKVDQEIEKWNRKAKKVRSETQKSTVEFKSGETSSTKKKIKWKTLTALILLPWASWFEAINFYFAALFPVWSIQGMKNRQAFYIDNISHDDNPVLFWLVSILWIVFSGMSLLYSEPIMDLLYAY